MNTIEQQILARMQTLMFGVFRLIDETGIDMHITKDGTMIFSDSKTNYHREITKDGVNEMKEAYEELKHNKQSLRKKTIKKYHVIYNEGEDMAEVADTEISSIIREEFNGIKRRGEQQDIYDDIVCNVFFDRYVSHLSNCGNKIITRNPKDAKRFATKEEAEKYVDNITDVFEVEE